MHRIKIYDKGFNPLTTIFPPFVYDLKYVNELSKSGNASFRIRVKDAKATATNLQLYNKIKIYRGTKGVFIGYIENLKADLNEIEVNCQGILKLFNKRITSSSLTGVNAGTACSDILTATNAVNDTGISFGTSDLTYTINDVNFSRSTIFAAWEKIVTMGGGEMEITTDKELNAKNRIGSDKSSSIIFQYISTQINTATVYDFDVEVQGQDTVNSLTGIRASGAVTKSDATSITKFGLLEDVKNFSQTSNSTDLNTETENYLDTHKVEFYVPKISPNPNKISVDSYNVGDSVRVILNNGFMAVDEIYRIIKTIINVSENGTLEVEVSLSPESTNLLPSTFFENIDDIKKRVSLLEGEIT